MDELASALQYDGNMTNIETINATVLDGVLGRIVDYEPPFVMP